ncbi:atrial natriuretic peptide receptor 1-like protein, partial [Dinothrombium tinctorium]
FELLLRPGSKPNLTETYTTIQVFRTRHGSRNISYATRILATFHGFRQIYERHEGMMIHWPNENGKAPLDVPYCGFMGAAPKCAIPAFSVDWTFKFAMITDIELIQGTGPFEAPDRAGRKKKNLDPDEILDRLRIGTSPPFRFTNACLLG